MNNIPAITYRCVVPISKAKPYVLGYDPKIKNCGTTRKASENSRGSIAATYIIILYGIETP